MDQHKWLGSTEPRERASAGTVSCVRVKNSPGLERRRCEARNQFWKLEGNGWCSKAIYKITKRQKRKEKIERVVFLWGHRFSFPAQCPEGLCLGPKEEDPRQIWSELKCSAAPSLLSLVCSLWATAGPQ